MNERSKDPEVRRAAYRWCAGALFTVTQAKTSYGATIAVQAEIDHIIETMRAAGEVPPAREVTAEEVSARYESKPVEVTPVPAKAFTPTPPAPIAPATVAAIAALDESMPELRSGSVVCPRCRQVADPENHPCIAKVAVMP